MSVYGGHGKLYEKYDYIGEFLNEYRVGNTQCGIFKIDNKWVGECEVHLVSKKLYICVGYI